MTTIPELQQQLISHKYDAYIITRNNNFIGQDILDEENKIKELTGFTGSAGNLIIFRNKAVLLVDGRYDIQARKQTDPKLIEVVCTRDSIGGWIQNNIEDSCSFAYDPWCHSVAEVDFWKRALDRHNFIEDTNQLLGSRISKKEANIFELDEEFAGISSEEKISYLTKFCNENKLDAYLICECDCVSWLMNLRSDLIKNTPILRAFALVSAEGEISLFTNDFSSLEKELNAYENKTVGIAYNRTPKKIQTIMKDQHIWVRNVNNPIVDWKAIKNPIEINGFKSAHIRDGVAICNFLHWLETNWHGSDELSIVAKLKEFRSQQEHFYSDSFETIAGFGANGAIIHYQPTNETNKKLEDGSVLLLDSGAQYLDGTTDITRTIAIGNPSNEIIDSYTHVLKSHIAVASSLFPQETTGQSIDVIARAALWQYGKEYSHGTGHGVGHFLNVHEGPQSISYKNSVSLRKDMITSIEPGFYKENEYGIRLENLARIIETSTEFTPSMLKFEPLTMVPFDKRLINKDLLNPKEVEWLNNYHKIVYDNISPRLDTNTLKWLKEATSAL